MTKLTSQDKWLTSLICGLLFMIIASPFLFSTVSGLTEMFGLKIATNEGCPNTAGLIVHGAVFALVVRILMGY